MESVLPDIFLNVLNMSITAAYVALAVCILRLMLKKAPKAISFALWLIVLFRLVCPVSFSSPVSLMRLGNVAPAAQQGGGMAYIQGPAAYHAPTAPAVTAAAPASTVTNITPVAAVPANPAVTLLFIAAVVWAAGVVVMLTLSVISHIRLKFRISDATLLYGNVYETDAIQSPFVLGVVRPRIYLPAGIGESELDYVLRHERMHIVRRDNVIKPLAYAVLCLHWFNPFVWIAFRLMCCDMEMSCDERVLRGMGERDKAGYSEALLKLSTGRRLLAGSPLAFGESSVKSRISNALNFKKPVFWIAAVAAVAAIATGVCLIANPSGTASAQTEALYGSYKFNKQVYMNSLSSFLAFDGYEQYYTLTSDKLALIDALGGQRSIPITYERSIVDEQDFKAGFDKIEVNLGLNAPDISQYKQRYQYTLCKPDEYASGYRLYLMDDEFWFAELHDIKELNGPNNECIWSIYRIERFGGQLPEPKETPLPEDPAAATSTAVPPESTDSVARMFSEVTVELNIDRQSIYGLSIADNNQLQIIEGAIANYLLKSVALKGVDISKVNDYIKICGVNSSQKESVYYVFDKDGKHCMQEGENGTYSVISDEAYEPLLQLALGYYMRNSMTVDSGRSSVNVFENTLWIKDQNGLSDMTRLAPQQVADYIQYLNIDPAGGELAPFTPYINGEKVYGQYRLYDNNFNEIPVVQPSGLEPQTYIFANAQWPGTYIVEFETTVQQSDGSEAGLQYFFGVSLPEKAEKQSQPAVSYVIHGTKDGVDAFESAYEYKSSYDNDECYNITPQYIKDNSQYTIFKYDTSCESFLMYRGEVYKLGTGVGGYGVTSMALADLNGDGESELYFTFSWGSGIHRSQAAYFDPSKKVVTVFDYAYMDKDMLVAQNGQGGLSLYAAKIISMSSFVDIEAETADCISDIIYSNNEIALSVPTETAD